MKEKIIKSVYFDMTDEEEAALYHLIAKKGKFSRVVKRALRDYLVIGAAAKEECADEVVFEEFSGDEIGVIY